MCWGVGWGGILLCERTNLVPIISDAVSPMVMEAVKR